MPSETQDPRPRTQDVLSVNIDLDDLRFYRGIHALPQRAPEPTIFTAAVPRFLETCARAGVPATLFTVADDLRWPEAVRELRAAAGRGHEIGSHSRTHAYDLTKRPPPEVMAEVSDSKAMLEDALGAPVVGFRAPGYNLAPVLLAALRLADYRYDSSILPSPPYWAARAAVIGWMRLTGRRSSSIVGRGRDFLRAGRPFRWEGEGEGLIEYPMTASGPLGMPLIGTFLGDRGLLSRRLVAGALRRPFVNVEFHALDFLGLDEDGLEPGLAVEPILRIPLADRLARFEEVLRTLARGRVAAALRDLRPDL